MPRVDGTARRGGGLRDRRTDGRVDTFRAGRRAGGSDLGSGSRAGKDGWSLVLGRPNLKPIVEHSDDLDAIVAQLLSE